MWRRERGSNRMGLPRLRLSDENIGRVMLVAFAAVGTVAVLGSVYAATRIEYGLHSHHHFHMPALQAIHEVDSRLKETVQEALAYLASEHAGEKAEFRSLVAQFEVDAERFRQVARIDTPGEEEKRELFESTVALARTVMERSERMFERFDHGGSVDAQSFSEYEELVDRLNAKLDALVRAEQRQVDLEHTRALAQLRQAKPLFVGIGVLTLVLALVFGRSVGPRSGGTRPNAESRKRRVAASICGCARHRSSRASACWRADFSIVDWSGDRPRLLGFQSDLMLGGDDIDQMLATWVAERVLKEYNWDLRNYREVSARLVAECERAKIRLCFFDETALDLSQIDPECPAATESFPISRDVLDGISQDLARQTFITCDGVLAKTGMRPKDLDAIFLAGGSTHLAKVREGVETYFGQRGRFELEPTEVVALGASQVAS